MQPQEVINNLQFSLACFQRTISVFTEEDGEFIPEEGMMSVAQQIAHVGQTAKWFCDATMKGVFDLDFESHVQEINAFTSVSMAKEYLVDAFHQVITTIQEVDEVWLTETMPPGPILGGAPRYAVLMSIEEHAAHHRGSLAVYARLLGKVPPMPYGDM